MKEYFESKYLGSLFQQIEMWVNDFNSEIENIKIVIEGDAEFGYSAV